MGQNQIQPVRIGDRLVGPGQPVFCIAEAGINHNGDMAIARKLIAASAIAGCDAVKFQKRTVDVVYTAEELAKPRENPFGPTNGDLKRGLELNEHAYDEIDICCASHGILWTASCWDEASVDEITELLRLSAAVPFRGSFLKIASASLTDDSLLRRFRQSGNPIVLSTGMSTLAEIDHAVEVLGTDNLVILHCTSTYPSKPDELNLRCIPMLQERYGVPIGYSGHETGLAPTLAAVALGACMVERHITLDRAMWGSDQAASIEPHGMARLVRDIRAIEAALGDGVKRVYDSELPVKQKLRRVG